MSTVIIQWDEFEERFSKLETQVSDISHNMVILKVIVERNFGPSREFGSSNQKLDLMRNVEKKKNQIHIQKKRDQFLASPFPYICSKWNQNGC
jgi:hypothetical protein